MRLALALVLGPARADPVPSEYSLTWEAPAPCPDQEAIRARVQALLTRDSIGEGTAHVRGTIQRSVGGFALTLTTEFRGGVETREVQAERCADLAETTAILLAVALEPPLAPTLMPYQASSTAPGLVPAPRGSVPPPGPEAARTRVELSQWTDPVARRPRPRPHGRPAARGPARPSVGLVAGLGAAAEIGVLQTSVTGGPRASLGLLWPRVRAQLHGGYLGPRRRTDSTGRGGLYQAGVVGARACYRARLQALQAPLCVGAEAGTVRVDPRGLGPAASGPRHGPWLGPLVSAGLGWTRARLGVWVALEAVGRAWGSEFRVARASQLRQLPVSSRLVVGLEFLFVGDDR